MCYRCCTAILVQNKEKRGKLEVREHMKDETEKITDVQYAV